MVKGVFCLMIIVLIKDAEPEQIQALYASLDSYGVTISDIPSASATVWCVGGDLSSIDIEWVRSNSIVDAVHHIRKPYPIASRSFHPHDTIVEVAGIPIGQGHVCVIAGPCSVESEQQILAIAQQVKQSGASLLRGGAFKPRTSPYAFQGLQAQGLSHLLQAKKATGLPIVTELTSLEHLDLYADVDVIQVGARNMQNFEMLKQLGRCDKPILLKRGMASTLEELLMSAEYILAGGNHRVILCERGIRTYQGITRNTLDLSAVPLLKHDSHLPVLVDPSHAAGIPWLMEPLSQAAIAVGADGLMLEVHNDPENALCDGAQSLTCEKFDDIMQKVKAYAQFASKVI